MSHLFIIIIGLWNHSSHRGQYEWSPGVCTYSSRVWSGYKREEWGKELNDDDDEVKYSTNYDDDDNDDVDDV